MSEAFAVGGASCRLHAEAPSWDGRRTAAIGSLAIPDAASGAAMLRQAAARLAARGAQAVLAPMDGDTWHAYRVVTGTDGSPPFPMEPTSGPHDLAALTEAGFATVARYVSTRVPADAPGPATPPMPGIAIEAWDGRDAEAMLRAILALSLRAFARNAFYRPIGEEAFLAMYRPLVARLDPGLVLLARGAAGRLVGFLLAFPDGGDPPRLVMKTFASLRFGAGALLLAEIRRRARARGYAGLIHALMHEENRSVALSRAEGGVVFRRYALMGLRL